MELITIKGNSSLNLLLNLPLDLRAKLISIVQSEKFLPGKVELVALVGDNVDIVDKSVENLGGTFENLGFGFGIITFPVENLDNITKVQGVSYIELPQVLFTTDLQSNKASCIEPLWDLYGLTGKGVLVGVIDSGIDYMHPAFRDMEGKTRIEYIYDLSKGGVVYSKRQIDEAIASTNPLSIVDSVDTNGHGTHVTSISCAGGNINRNLYGVAYESSIAMVKLTPEGQANFTKSTLIMRGIKFLVDKSNEMNVPLVINLSFSTNDGAHNGSTLLEQYINTVCSVENITFVVAAGNEGDRSHHVGGNLRPEQNISLAIAPDEPGIILQLYKGILSNISIEVKNPSGESTGRVRINEGFKENRAGRDRVLMYYSGPKPFDLEGEISIALLAGDTNYLLPGTWTVSIYLENEDISRFDMWLPIAEGLSIDTKFLKPNIFNTLGIPATAKQVISVGSYNHVTGNISAFSGRGGESNIVLKPDLVAPGENIQGAIPGRRFDTKTGTSMATPQVSGVCALFMEWGIVKNNDPFLFGQRLKYFLIKGAKRSRPLLVYPNFTWGYGTLCAQSSFQVLLSEKAISRDYIGLRAMRASCKELYLNPKYENYIVEYDGDIVGALDSIDYACAFILDENYAVVTVERGKERELLRRVKEIVYFQPKTPFTLNISPLDAANINKFNTNPYLNLTGRGVIIGVLDTGIDYLSEEFMYEDDTTKIISIWDQTINTGEPPGGIIFGTEYSRDEINRAIQAKRSGEDPYTIVPSRDEIGHGTSMSCIIAGRGRNPEVKGGAPDAELVVIKLKTTNNVLNTPVPVYEETDIIIGLKYLATVARRLNKPMVIYVPLGSNLGSHDGNSIIERYIDDVSRTRGVVAVTSTGNEGDAANHSSGVIENTGDFQILELNVSKEQKQLVLEIWVRKPDKVSIGIISPSGEVIEKIPAKLQEIEEIKFIYEGTRVFVEYYLPEELTGDELIWIRMEDLKEGIWQFKLIGDYIVTGRFDSYIWQKGLLLGDTRFLNPTPYGTLTIPSTGRYIISTSHYDQNNNSILPVAGRGFTRDDRIKPDITSGGIGAKTILPGGQITTVSGGSVGSAVLASACALLLQWGIVDGNDPTLYAPKLKTYLIRGASKRPGDVYPNREWGYGMLNLEGVFESVRSVFNCIHCQEQPVFLPKNVEDIKDMVLGRNQEV